MRWPALLAAVALLCAGAVRAQPHPFAQVDRHADSIGYLPVDSLAGALTGAYSSERLKVRAIFRWMALRIAYDVARYHALADGTARLPTLPADLPPDRVDSWLTTQYAQQTLLDRRGVCNDYSHLFKYLCQMAGLRCEVVTGLSRSHSGAGRGERHAWNAVRIAGVWHLTDVTWSAGTCDRNITRFTRLFDETYFLPSPERMALDHYPDSLRWHLVANRESLEAFRSRPFLHQIPALQGIATYTPKQGQLPARIGDTLLLTLTGSGPLSNIAAGVEDDTGAYVFSERWVPSETHVPVYQKLSPTSKAFRDDADALLAYVNAVPGTPDAGTAPVAAKNLRPECRPLRGGRVWQCRVPVQAGTRSIHLYRNGLPVLSYRVEVRP